ncbi:MAG TPA: AEC family transporter, partial [Allocoleopsis sp.]
MPGLESLLKLYIPLILWVGLGLILGRVLPPQIPLRLGKFLFWVGVPIGIMIFLRQADLSGSVWLAPLVSWIAVLLGAGLAGLWIKAQVTLAARSHELTRSHALQGEQAGQSPKLLPRLVQGLEPQQLCRSQSQGSFLLSTMVGNTGYLGYPIILALIGPQYFGWAIFYDTLGSTLAAYGLGVMLATYFGKTPEKRTTNRSQLLQALIKNPAFWSFWLGLGWHDFPLPEPLDQHLIFVAWSVVALSLLLLGIRLSQLASWHKIQHAIASLSIKMLLIPLLIGCGLRIAGMTGSPLLVLVLQAGMPPAFATLVITEAFDLDRDLTVTTLAIGTTVILFTLPLWL